MTEQRHAGGRHTFLGLAAVILGGLLFAAGVMVGRQMGVGQDERHKDHLDRIDQRDEGQAAVDGGGLVFHKELSRPKPVKKIPALPKTPDKKPDAPPAAAKPEPVKAAAQSKAFALQVASYQDSTQAKELLSRLDGKGYGKARVVKAEVPGKGTYFRVRLGPFPDRAKAQKVQEKLQKGEGLKALVVVEE